jgi:hypothetical protein
MYKYYYLVKTARGTTIPVFLGSVKFEDSLRLFKGLVRSLIRLRYG